MVTFLKSSHASLPHSVAPCSRPPSTHARDSWTLTDESGPGSCGVTAPFSWVLVHTSFQKNICLCFIDYAKDFDCVDHNKLWKILKEMGIPDHLTCLLRNLYAGQETTVRTLHGTTDWFQIEKRVCQDLYCHPAYLTYMQSTSCGMLGWMKHKLGSRLPGEISVTSDMQMTPTL